MSNDKVKGIDLTKLSCLVPIIAALITACAAISVAVINIFISPQNQIIALTLTAVKNTSNLQPTLFVPTIQSNQPTSMPQPLNPTPLPINTSVALSTFGNWSSTAKKLVVTVVQVDIINQNNNGKFLRFHIQVNNGYNDSLTIPSYRNIQAIDEIGRVYEPSLLDNGWTTEYPAALLISSTLDLADAVPLEVKSVTLSLSTIYGSGFDSLELSGQGINIYNIEIP